MMSKNDDRTPIKFLLQKARGSCWVHAPNDVVYDYGQHHLKARAIIKCKLSFVKDLSSRPTFTSYLTWKLLRIGVPETQHPSIVEQVFRVLDKAVPSLPIVVSIQHSTVRISESLNDHRSRVERIRKADSEFIEGLEKVRSVGQTPPLCAICLEGLSPSQGKDIARLHCSTFITKIACPVAEEESLVYRLPIPYANLPSEQTIKPTQMPPAATCYEQVVSLMEDI